MAAQRSDSGIEHDDWHEEGIPERPPTGDVVEVAGLREEDEYEIIRSPPPWLTPLAISVVTLFAVFVVTRAAVIDEVDAIALSGAPEGAVPSVLADGSPLPELPDAIRSRFSAPVVGTQVMEQSPAGLDATCVQPFTSEQLDQASFDQIRDVISNGQISDQRLGPDTYTVLRTGAADSPPDWPDTWFLSCMGRLEDGNWVARPPRLDFARNGDRGAADGVPGTVARLVQMPAEATWAVHERDGWWLAAQAEPGGWLQMVVPLPRANEPVRVVFLNDDGEVQTDQLLASPATPAGETDNDGEEPAGDRTLDVGAVRDILTASGEGPVRRCNDDLSVCVWITLVGSELQAHTAHGSHHLDVPPFGELGWCPEAGRFQGTVTRSQFLPDGEWRFGIAPRNVDTYALRFSGGRVVVDFGERLLGEPTDGEARPAPFCTFSGDPTGEEAPDQDAIAPL